MSFSDSLDTRSESSRSREREAVAGGMAALIAQTRMEIRLTLRRFEAVLITMIVPVVLLVFFSLIDLAPEEFARPIDFLLPSMLVLAVMSTGLVGLAIRTGYERSYGVLKRLGSTPLGRTNLLIAKINSVLLLTLVQVVVLIGIAMLGFGWEPEGNLLLAAVVLILGTATFSGLGLLLAGMLRAETTLGMANTLYVFFLLFGGIIWPADRLPGALALPAQLLPSSAFSTAMRDILSNGEFALAPVLILAGWGIAGILIASRTFRWE
ncbi:MAG: ABC transporter permease [Chloroflexota bacterium]